MSKRYRKAALPTAGSATINTDAGNLGLINAPRSSVTSTVVGTQTVTSSVTAGSPAVCVLLPSTTAVAPSPPPVTGTSYNVYKYLRCNSSGRASAPAFPAVTSTGTPSDTSSLPPAPPPAPGPTDVTGPTEPPTTGPTEPIPSPTPPRCLLGLLCG